MSYSVAIKSSYVLCYSSTFPKDEGKTTKQPLRPLQKICEVKKCPIDDAKLVAGLVSQS